jgi:ABC-type uncharacterized transport system permease subunit
MKRLLLRARLVAYWMFVYLPVVAPLLLCVSVLIQARDICLNLAAEFRKDWKGLTHDAD